jgi:hypothetical protein
MTTFSSLLTSASLLGLLALGISSCRNDEPTLSSQLREVSHQLANPGDTIVLRGAFHMAEPAVYLGQLRLDLTKADSREIRALLPPEASSELLSIHGKTEFVAGPLLEIYDRDWRRAIGAGVFIEHLRFLPANPLYGWALGRIEAAPGYSLWRTQNGGASWSRTDIGLLPASEFHSFDPLSETLIWARSHHRLFKSTDGGSSWAEVQFDLPNIEKALFLDDNTGFILSRDDAAGVHRFYKTLDGGQGWQPLHERQYIDHDSYFVALSSTQAGFVDYRHQEIHMLDKHSSAVSLRNMPRLVPDAAPLSLSEGATWFAAGSLSTSFGRQLPGDDFMTYSTQNLLWASTDRGSSWQRVKVPAAENCWGLVAIRSQGNAVWALDLNGTILSSSDGGASWQARRFDRYAIEEVKDLYLTPGGRAFLLNGDGELYMKEY